MRISEGLQLRVKDLDFDHGDHRAGGQGAQGSGLDVASLAPSLRERLYRARAWWLKDQAEAAAALRFPTLGGSIRAGHSWPWFWVFAQHTHSTDPRSGVVRRHHM